MIRMLLLCLATVVFSNSDIVVASDLKVMSFNIRYGSANDGPDAWPMRREQVANVIKAYQPDLLGTQETLPFQAEFLKEQFAEYQYVGWSRDSSENGEQCGIFLKRSRFEVVDSGQFWLSETPDEKFSKSWDSSLPRVVTWVRLKDRETADHEFLFANTHFDHRGEVARKMSAALLRTRLLEMAPMLPIVVTGDFNCDEGSEPYIELTRETTLTDSFRAMHSAKSGNEGTFHGFSGKPGTERIDWILSTSQLLAREAEIVRSNVDGRYPSDHFPVTALLQWKSQ